MSLSVSLIIPTYNESLIADRLERLVAYLQTVPQYRFDLVVVDDSEDGTDELAKQFLARSPIPGIVLKGDGRGKGSAIRIGAQASRGDVVFYMDADLTIPIENIPGFVRLIDQEQFDLVVGEREDKRDLAKFKENPLRFVLSLFLLYGQKYFIFQSSFFRDTQCGFKAFRGSVVRKIAAQQRLSGGMYDIEYLYIARKNRLRISLQEVTPLPEVRASTIRVWKCLYQDPLELL